MVVVGRLWRWGRPIYVGILMSGGRLKACQISCPRYLRMDFTVCELGNKVSENGNDPGITDA